MMIISGYLKLFYGDVGVRADLFAGASLQLTYPPAHHLPSSLNSLLIKRQYVSLNEFTNVQNKAEAVRA